MPDIKETSKDRKPKVRNKVALLPRQAGRWLKEKYLRRLDRRQPEEAGGAEYATEQVERGAQWAAGMADSATRRPAKEQRKHTGHTSPGRKAGREATPSTGPAQAQEPPFNWPRERPVDDGATSPERAPADPRSNRAGPPPIHTALNNTRRGHAALRKPTTGMTPRSAQAFSGIGTPPTEISAGGAAMPARPRALVKEQPRASSATVKTRANLRAGMCAPGHRPGPKLRPPVLRAAVRQSARNARQTARRHMTRQMAAQARKTARAAAALTKRVTVALVRTASALVSALAGLLGGGFLLLALVAVVLIAAVASSPFGLFFAAEPNAPDTLSVSEAVARVNMDYNARLEELQEGGYDDVVMHGQAPDWPDVLAVFAVRLAGADREGMDVATLDDRRVERLKAVFWDMTAISSYVEAIDHPGDGESDPGWRSYILHITITAGTAGEMRTAYGFTPYQNSALDELLSDRAALAALAGSLTITNADVTAILDALPDDLSPQRREAVRTALQLVGKVSYFWGGKSSAIGWDSRWGTLQKVSAPGNSTTGTYRPFGLDCTGMIDWVYRNTGLPSDGHWYIGTNLTELAWADALPGDIALFPDASHVGIVVGRSLDGGILVCHCSYSQNNVVVSDCAETGFTAIGRPEVFD